MLLFDAEMVWVEQALGWYLINQDVLRCEDIGVRSSSPVDTSRCRLTSLYTRPSVTFLITKSPFSKAYILKPSYERTSAALYN